ncbi:MAG: hypothetical protein CMJ78_23065 [Planctomycetaceae bacterium]|nr:hypothetical protein [Planctomycetaceae bacterium]
MSTLSLNLPTIQNWSCHSCGGCCRQHLIELTEEERQRIIEQNWTEADGIPADQPVMVKMSRMPWSKTYRLGHQPDGACVFLDDEGLCRIHAKFGEAAKPWPCRIYPFAFHPAGKTLTVSLRYSCPSVVSNLGQAVSKQGKSLKEMTRAVVPDGVEKIPAPKVSPRGTVEWNDFHQFIDALDQTFAGNATFTVKLLQALYWLNVLENAHFGLVNGSRLTELLSIITEAARADLTEDQLTIEQPRKAGRLQFRMLAAQYARKDTLVDLESGVSGRIKLLKAAFRFARGKGTIPPLQEAFKEIEFASLERPFGGLTDEADEIFTRYFRVKIRGIHFCGRAYYDLPMIEGFRSLALIYPSIMWLSRWLAAGDGRDELTTDDISQAITIADHYHAYSPAFGQMSFRRRVKLLAQTGDLQRLCLWYSQ